MATPLIGTSNVTEMIRELTTHIADTGLNVLISGEPGVGKEVVALNIYNKSKTENKPFVKVNCAALPEKLLERELFGFERDAFDGAYRKKKGMFELSAQGVLFLDKIEEMPINTQKKLLIVIQTGEFAPLGSEKDIKTDSWVIASTTQDLEKKVEKGLFREDLYYRLNIIKIYIPPLRERPEDIPPLIDYYLEKYISQFGIKQISRPDPDTMNMLMAYNWPGNVRELLSVLENYINLGNWNDIIENLYLEDKYVSESISDLTRASIDNFMSDFKRQYSLKDISSPLNIFRKTVKKRIESDVISHVLNKKGWNRAKVIEILKIGSKELFKNKRA